MPLEADGKTHIPFQALEKRIGHRFRNHHSLEQALTHASATNKGSENGVHYERLEFLGDRILGACITEQLYRTYPQANEGELSLRLNSLVNGSTLTQISDELKLYEFIRTGSDLKHIMGKRMQSVRADVLEALIAAIYLDDGLEAAAAFIRRFWAGHMVAKTNARRDSKTELQEWAHATNLAAPEYVEKDRTGPDHAPVFSITLSITGYEPSEGHGRSKRIAEQAAAKAMLVREGIWDDDDDKKGEDK